MKDQIRKILEESGATPETVGRVIKELEEVGMAGRVRITTCRVGTKEILRQSPWMKNLLVSSNDYGRNLVCQRLAGTNTYTLNVTHGEIGTGLTVPANGDIALTTPTVRVALTTAIVTNNVVQLQFFFSDATLANGTYREFGCFIDGAVGLGTGRMLEHILFGAPYTKASGEDTTVEVDITITSV